MGLAHVLDAQSDTAVVEQKFNPGFDGGEDFRMR